VNTPVETAPPTIATPGVLPKMLPEMQAYLALREQLESMDDLQHVSARVNFDPTDRQSHFVGEISHDCMHSQAIRRRGVNVLDQQKLESMISLACQVHVRISSFT